MIAWWEPGNQILSSVLSRPYPFSDFLDWPDLLSLSQSCRTVRTICVWVIETVLKEKLEKALNPIDLEMMDSSSAAGSSSIELTKLPDNLKRRYTAQEFDTENERQDRESSRPKLSSQHDADIRNLWNGLVSTSAKSIMTRTGSLPWERGIAGIVLGEGRAMNLHNMPTISTAPIRFLQDQDPEDAAKSARAVIITRLESIPGAWQLAAQRLSSLNIRADKILNARTIALNKWKEILVQKPEASTLGRTLLADLMSFKSDVHLSSVIEDVFSMKSTATVDKRANHLLLFVAWCGRADNDPFPVIERVFYGFLKDDRSAKSPTSVKSCLESMNLASSTIGLDGAKDSASSPRVLGLAHKLLLTKRPRKQAKTLTCVQVLKLERTLTNQEADIKDRIAAGHLLWLTFGRIRWSDGECGEALIVDVNDQGYGYIQVDALGSKTSVSAQQKTTYFPFVAPASGLETPLWFDTWLKLRKKEGLLQLPRTETQKDPRIPFMPAIMVGGAFGTVPMSSGEGSRLLRAILRQAGEKEDEIAGLSSHSLKATLLSWMRKWGADPFHSKVAGYHAIRGEGSMFSYGRDNLASTLREIDKMMSDIRSGHFNPDVTRSGYFKSGGENHPSAKTGRDSQPAKTFASGSDGISWEQKEAGQTDGDGIEGPGQEEEMVEVEFPEFEDPHIAVEEVCALVGDAQDSSSESSSSDSDAEAIEALSFINPAIRAPAKSRSTSFVVHSFNKTLHALKDAAGSKTACGKVVHEGYTVFEDEPSFPFHKCAVCFGTVVDLS